MTFRLRARAASEASGGAVPHFVLFF